MCRVVKKWTTTHDAQLIELYAYLESAGSIALRSELSLEDLDEVQLVMWSDADWAGDPDGIKSTFGLLLEFANPTNERGWLISWAVRRQTSISSSTGEAETVALCCAAKHEGIPTMILLDALLQNARSPIESIGKVVNTQAIIAIHKGYSKKLKYIERTHKCSIGSVHEFIESGQLCVDYAATLARRGGGFTKCLNPLAKFVETRKMMSLIST